MTGWTKGTLIKGRIEVGSRIHVKTKDGEFHGDVCETQQQGKEHPRAVIKRKYDLASIEFENVSPGATQKRQTKGAK